MLLHVCVFIWCQLGNWDRSTHPFDFYEQRVGLSYGLQVPTFGLKFYACHLTAATSGRAVVFSGDPDRSVLNKTA